MVQIYNYMTDGYLPKPAVKNYAHKSGELKRIYGSIIRLSRTAPLYKIDLSSKNQLYTFGIKETAITLQSKINDMTDSQCSCFSQKTVKVSNPDVLSAKLVNNDTDKLLDKITMSIQELAAPQINVGKDLYQSSHNLNRGIYDFRALLKDKIYNLSFNQTDISDNGDTLDQIADYLNNTLPGISATVMQGDTKGFIHMVISPDFTGKIGERSFSFEDTQYTGDGLVAAFGLNQMKKDGVNARFTVNNAEKSTYSNSFLLEDTIKISLHSTSDTPVIIQIVPDSRMILDQLNSVLNIFNNLLQDAARKREDGGEHSGAGKLISELENIEKTYQDELEGCGITIGENGILSTQEVRSVEAAENGEVENLFKKDSGFIAAVLEKADDIAINPIEYSDKVLITYPNRNRFFYTNPYITSMYSGLFFNSYC